MCYIRISGLIDKNSGLLHLRTIVDAKVIIISLFFHIELYNTYNFKQYMYDVV